MALAFVSAVSPAQAPRGGTIAIRPTTADGDYDRTMPQFVEAVGQALDRRAFTVLDDPAHAAYTVDLILGHADVGTGLAKDPNGASVSVGPGVIVPFSTGDSQLTALRRTRLELRISRRGGGVVWDGSAVTVRQSGTRGGDDRSVAAALCEALLRGYPAQPQGEIGVP